MANRPSDLPSLAEEGEVEATRVADDLVDQPTPSSRTQPFLVVLAGGSVGEMFALRVPELVIGRARNAAVRLDDDGVSRRHARIYCKGTNVFVEDLGSANGTRVNDEKLADARLLADGDKITLGSTTILKFTYSDEIEESFQRRMFSAALRDGLTKTYNRSYLSERLGKEVAFSVRHGTPLSLLVLDVDHFKKVNDTYGHPAGDALLVALADVVHESIRAEDLFARLGGEEFAILCRAVDVKSSQVLAERLRSRIEALRVKHQDKELSATISIGVAALSELTTKTADALMKAADEALYEAKRAGRNRVVARTNSESPIKIS